MKVLEKFQRTTGLKINKNKSENVFGGINQDTEKEMLRMEDMKLGQFPFTYLGSPITSARMKVHECDALLDKLSTRIIAWGSRHFSYMARIRLIN
ncbi:unnamed protein product [Cuscuta campestris]|uniref:Reverse transcriptase domain-containing protein n=1 Tax=Cuscuta campestris TaxID=132261 RepID=A0A484L5S0_9ASTE|nr:unnamed protein product [Cuscuta campestris]